MPGGQAQSGFASSMIHGQNSTAARHAGVRVPLPARPRLKYSEPKKDNNPSGKFRAFLNRVFGHQQSS